MIQLQQLDDQIKSHVKTLSEKLSETQKHLDETRDLAESLKPKPQEETSPVVPKGVVVVVDESDSINLGNMSLREAFGRRSKDE
jgi:hypothetical protein